MQEQGGLPAWLVPLRKLGCADNPAIAAAASPLLSGTCHAPTCSPSGSLTPSTTGVCLVPCVVLCAPCAYVCVLYVQGLQGSGLSWLHRLWLRHPLLWCAPALPLPPHCVPACHRVLMPSELYAPGVVPPPHLSPFVDNEAEGYTPEFAHTIRQLQVGGCAGLGQKP